MLVATETAFTDPNGLFKASVLVDGQPLGIAPDGKGRYSMHSLGGKHFSIEVENLTKAPIEVLVAVDQRNALNPCQCAIPEQMIGFVIDGETTHHFQGWRTSDEYVSQFAFDSDPCMLGVIGIGAFTEVNLRPRTAYLKGSGEAIHSGHVDTASAPESEEHFVLEALSVIPSTVARRLFTRQPGSFSMATLCYRSPDADRVGTPPLGFISAGPRTCLTEMPNA